MGREASLLAPVVRIEPRCEPVVLNVRPSAPRYGSSETASPSSRISNSSVTFSSGGTLSGVIATSYPSADASRVDPTRFVVGGARREEVHAEGRRPSIDEDVDERSIGSRIRKGERNRPRPVLVQVRMQVLKAREVPPDEDQVGEPVVGLLELGDDVSVPSRTSYDHSSSAPESIRVSDVSSRRPFAETVSPPGSA